MKVVPSFNTLTFSIEGIDDWVEVSSIKVEEQRERRTMTISYEPPENVSFNLTNGMQLTIIFDVRHTSSLIPREERIVQKTYFKLVSQEAHELDQFISVARKITEFLCFAINETVCLDNMWATSDDLREDIGGGETSPIRINIYYPSWPYSKDEPKIAWYDMLFKFKEIQNDAERIINNWIDAYEQIAPAFNLYFLAKMGAQTYLEERFSTLVQGLEAYHRRTSNEKQMAEVDFEELIENLMEHCPGEKKEWLRGKLRYGNEVSLRKRIKKLIEPFKYLFGNKEKRKKLANRIVDTRNYLTHYDLSLESKTAKGKDLWTLCLKMELLLELHILQLVGFSEEKIDSIVDNCPKLKRKCTL